MQIVTNNKLKPIKLAAAGAAASMLLYGDFDRCSGLDTVVSDYRMQEYVMSVDDMSDSNLFLRTRFNLLYESWYKGTMFMSSVKSIVNRHDFRAIVDMGKEAVPYILDKIDREPSPMGS